MTPPPLRIHATALLRGEAGLLIRGAAGAGKTGLALALVADAARAGGFARIIADDIVLLTAAHGRLVGRPHPTIVGLAERRGIGLLGVPCAPAGVIRAVVDLAGAADRPPDRLPETEDLRTSLGGITLPRLLLRAGSTVHERLGATLDFLAAFTTGS